MTPVVLLALDTGTPAFVFYPSCSDLTFSPVVYLITVAVRAGLLATPKGTRVHKELALIINIAQVSNLVLSLLTNVIATSIIASKSWCVRVIFRIGYYVDC